MATSPLLSALKPGMEDAEYTSALNDIKQALIARTTKSYNPTLLAMAQGFLAPTPTGSFGEGAGQAIKAVLGSQEQQQKEAMDVAQMRLQIAQAERDQARKNKGMQFLTERDEPTAQPTGGAPTGGATGAPPKGDDSGPAVPTSRGALTPRQISKIMYMDQELGKVLEAEYKMNLEAISVQPSGAYDKTTGRYVPFGGKTTVPRFAPADPATGRKAMNIDMSEGDAIEYDNARSAGDYKKLTAIIDRYTNFPQPQATQPAPTGAATQAAPVTQAKPVTSGAMNPTELKQQQDLELAAQKAENEALAKARADRTNAKIGAGDDASSRRQTAQVINDLFDQEGMDQVVGVLEKPGVLVGAMKLVEDGINLGGGFNISIPQVRDIFTANKITLPKVAGESKQQYDQRVSDVISRAQQALSLFAQVTFGMRSLAKGQGAISNFEQVIFDRMGPTARDSIQTIRAKTRHMAERANFDESLKNALVDNGMSFDKFSRTDEYKTMVQNYDKSIRGIYSGVTAPEAPRPPTPQGKKPSGGSKVSPDAKAKLDEQL